MVRTDGDAVRDGAIEEDDAREADAPERKLAAQVAHRLESDIIRRGWPVGEVLGSEQDLRERYRVSRSVLREAVRLAEHHQVARMRRGPGGGLFVCAPDAAPATRALVIYLEYVGTSVEDLMQARQLLEPLAVALAAERITEQDIERLRAGLDEEVERHDEAGIFAQDRVHVLLGELSGNPALQLFVDVLSRLTTRYAHTTRRIPKEEIDRGKAEARERHRVIVDAVIAGAAGRAEAETVAHLAGVSEWLLAHRARRGAKAAGRALEVSGAKLAEVVAARIHDEIARRGWPIGQVLGSEADLLARNGISRAVLREAVRLLEYHSVARMRRGPGGGLVVTEPDPGASIETMALYLDYRGVTAEDLRVVRDAVELGTLQQTIRRRAEPEVGQRLKAALARTGEPGPEGRSGSEAFHTELAEVSGNPVLALFLRILTELWTRHRAGTDTTPQPGPGALAEVEAVHERILDAVLAGDEGVARHRMRRHLEALTAWYH
ncbi:FCD domain-containing protein [Amycolatopsis acidiphila]|uniref:FadR family transcriptional regulator n=1 Tax=Amycolatopsis acidiphila TaxID=715473 RepID=A0A558AAZ1_9PSEU|nr:FCD domain-containing protein [Amycolatopsis acidiphila]TVT21441.1 FadR family transcriptional regulator [Amycolatopsis acidiphila]UIJ63114.1 FCD domain-containing protein [Amycolatopsis acidiphila]GHG73806.1 GntR family transcriptional regulator [Amycolatopsis acidiphila]